MISAVTLVFRLLSALLTGDRTGDFLNVVLNSLQLLVLFAVVLVYHLRTLRRDGAAKAEAPEAEAGQYALLLIDPGSGDFAARMRAALGKQGARLRVETVAAGGELPAGDFQAVILPASVVFDPPEGLKRWLEGFQGRRIVVPDAEDAAEGALLAGNAQQASMLARRLADGQQVVPGSVTSNPGWMIVVYVFAAIFALQLLFMLVMLGISSVVD
jgi:hypothetical protein